MTKSRTMPFDDAQRETLRVIAAAMIPASEEFLLPGAGDSAIFDDILASTGRDTTALADALTMLHSAVAGDLAALRSAGPGTVLERFRTENRALATTLELVIAQCYYRDDRVMRVIGMEPRAPFPKGYDMEQSDWSLLDPVRARGKIYRDVAEGGTP
jgi:hypothetical protein